jgi:hypothetical protein
MSIRKIEIQESELPVIEVSADKKYLPLTIQGGVARDTEKKITVIHTQTLAEITDRSNDKDTLGLLPTITLAALLVGLRVRGEALAIQFTHEEQVKINEVTANLIKEMLLHSE